MRALHAQVIATGAAAAAVSSVDADLVICADGGLDVALAAERRVDVVVGDFDSVSPAALDSVQADATVIAASTDKDESDLELALAEAVRRKATRITAHLAAGGRLDHQLANLAVLASPRWQRARVDAFVGTDRVFVVHGGPASEPQSIPLADGAPLALQPIGGPARVHTTGVRWPLAGEWLDATAARGIANEVVGAATVQVLDGVVLVISSSDPSSDQAT